VVDDAERVACAAADSADTVAKRYAIVPFRAADGAIARRENDAVTLVGGDDFGPGLRARHIFHEDKFAAFPIAALLAEHDQQLQSHLVPLDFTYAVLDSWIHWTARVSRPAADHLSELLREIVPRPTRPSRQ